MSGKAAEDNKMQAGNIRTFHDEITGMLVTVVFDGSVWYYTCWESLVSEENTAYDPYFDALIDELLQDVETLKEKEYAKKAYENAKKALGE